MKLSNAQHAAVDYFESPLLIEGRAGTGKSTVLAEKIAQMVQRKLVTLNQIAHLTRTNFLDFCLTILRHSGKKIGLRAGFKVADRWDQIRIAIDLLWDQPASSKQTPHDTLTSIARLKHNLVDEIRFGLEKQSVNYSESLAVAYSDYQHRLRSQNMIDVEDAPLLCVQLWQQDPKLLAEYRDRYKAVVVDEYECLSQAQYMVCKILADKTRYFFIAGDSHQNIYTTIHGNSDHLTHFDRDFPTLNTMVLNRSFGSAFPILEVANCIIHDKRKMHQQADDHGGESLIHYLAYDAEEEAGFIASEIKNYPNQSIAVMYRTRTQGHILKEYFQKRGVLSGNVHLMTLDQSKGTSFDIVFIAGVEEGLLPHFTAQVDHDALEEERRLFYLGVTRAHQKLFFSSAYERRIFGEKWNNDISRFLSDVPRPYIAGFASERLRSRSHGFLKHSEENGFHFEFWKSQQQLAHHLARKPRVSI